MNRMWKKLILMKVILLKFNNEIVGVQWISEVHSIDRKYIMLMKFKVKLNESDTCIVQHVVGCKCYVILYIDKDEYIRVF